MNALITGGSSGIGKEIAKVLAIRGYDLILVARDEEKLKAAALDMPKTIKVEIKVCDMGNREEIMKLYQDLKLESIDVVINNAGLGDYGYFNETSLDKELQMIDVNMAGMHILMKLFLNDFVSKNRGYILNVASAAAFAPSPYMATYYASKAYVYRLTRGVARELKIMKSKVYLGVLTPGPVKTNFDKVANVKFTINSLDASKVANYTVKKMFQRKLVIVPGILMKIGRVASKLAPDSLALLLLGKSAQKRKGKL